MDNPKASKADIQQALRTVWEAEGTIPTLCLDPDSDLTFSWNFPARIVYSSLVEPGQVWIISNAPTSERPTLRRIPGL